MVEAPTYPKCESGTCSVCGAAVGHYDGACFFCAVIVNNYRNTVAEAERCRKRAVECEREASVLLQKIIDRGLTP